VNDNTADANLRTDSPIGLQGLYRRLPDSLVFRRQIDQIDGVGNPGCHVDRGDPFQERGNVRVSGSADAPGRRATEEHLTTVAANRHLAINGLRQPPSNGDVSSDAHQALPPAQTRSRAIFLAGWMSSACICCAASSLSVVSPPRLMAPGVSAETSSQTAR